MVATYTQSENRKYLNKVNTHTHTHTHIKKLEYLNTDIFKYYLSLLVNPLLYINKLILIWVSTT